MVTYVVTSVQSGWILFHNSVLIMYIFPFYMFLRLSNYMDVCNIIKICDVYFHLFISDCVTFLDLICQMFVYLVVFNNQLWDDFSWFSDFLISTFLLILLFLFYFFFLSFFLTQVLSSSFFLMKTLMLLICLWVSFGCTLKFTWIIFLYSLLSK